MAILELPHSRGCLVCGKTNDHGLRLSLHVDTESRAVHMRYTAEPHHSGFVGIVHGGVLATVADEAMAWTAIWASARSVVAAEMTVRFKQIVRIGQTLLVQARPTRIRSRIVEVDCEMRDENNAVVATASGKFAILPPREAAAFLAMLDEDPSTAEAMGMIRAGAMAGVEKA